MSSFNVAFSIVKGFNPASNNGLLINNEMKLTQWSECEVCAVKNRCTAVSVYLSALSVRLRWIHHVTECTFFQDVSGFLLLPQSRTGFWRSPQEPSSTESPPETSSLAHLCWSERRNQSRTVLSAAEEGGNCSFKTGLLTSVDFLYLF